MGVVVFYSAALIIVTGPTVITPILRNIPLTKDVSTVLKWEGILIDPIGALVAVLVFEFISVGGGSGFTKTALIEFGKILLFGTTFGFTFAHALKFVINKNMIPHYLLNVVSLSTVLLVFVESDIFAHESGLLAVVVMGMVLGNSKLQNLNEILYFKESLSVLLISILFILLAANINMSDMMLLYNWKTALLFATVVFIIRPLAVFLSTGQSKLKVNEKLFISWVGPRGIVAAGIASLFGSKLMKQGIEGAEYITPLVFMIVLGTVLLNATTARMIAKALGVFLSKSDGILIIGAGQLSRLLGKYLKDNDRHVVLVDSNASNVQKAKDIGLEASKEDIYSDDLSNNIELNDIGFLLALTGNAEINTYAINKFREQFGEHGSFRLISSAEMNDPDNNPKEGLFSHTDDFVKLTDVVREFPQINETQIDSKEHFDQLLDVTSKDSHAIPLFIKTKSGSLEIIPASLNGLTIENGYEFVYMGKQLEFKAD